jgi:Lysozyme like domain
VRPSHRDGRFERLAPRIDALRHFQQHWTSGRRALAPAGLLALVVAVATSALVASGAEPRAKDAAATHTTRPSYLLPMGVLIQHGALPQPTLTGDRGSVGVPTGTPEPPTAPDPAQVAQQGSAIAAYGGSAGTLTPSAIATLALQHGCGPDAAVIATAIAMAESGGSPSAQGDIGLMTSVWDWSAGLWQIRGLRAERNTGGLRDSVANQAVGKNAAAMRAISQGCADWTPWSTFNSGAYLQFMTLAQQAVRYVVAYYDAHGHRYPPVPAPDPNAAIPSRGTGGGSAAQAGAAQAAGPRTAGPQRDRRATPTGTRSTTAGSRVGATVARTPTGAAPPPPATSSSSKPARLPLPLPTKVLPSKSVLPSLPLPLPTLPLPTLPHLP